jgi:O-antigen ligase
MTKAYQDFMQKLINAVIIFACFSLAMPTAWVSIASAILLFAWIISGKYSEKFKLIYKNPAAISVLILFSFYCIGAVYSSGTIKESGTFLLKYTKLLIIPMVISVVTTKKIRHYGMNAFLFGALILLGISYFKWLGIIPMNLGLHDMPDNSQGFLAFKNRIAHNILMSFLMFVFFCKAHLEKTLWRWVWFFIALLSLIDLMYLAGGRSGQIIALCFVLFLPLYFYGKEAFKYFVIAVISIFLLHKQLEPLMPGRLIKTGQEVSEHKSDEHLTSAGIRLEMYKNTLLLIKESPLIGYGTGALRSEYNKLANTQDTLLKDVPNPHNQYLLTFFELGIVGLAAFLFMFYRFWQHSNVIGRSDKHAGMFLKGVVLTIAIGSMFNSLLLDATEGKFFCVLTGLLLSAYTKKNG